MDVLSRWLFSVVEDRNDAARVLVRGRYREDIATLARKLGAQPQSTPEADYPWRPSASKRAWTNFLAQTAAAIDFANFKDVVAEPQGWNPHDAYLDVWSCMAKNARDDG